MKKLALLLSVVLLCSIYSFAGSAINGNSNTFLGSYEIKPIGENLYELRYEKAGASFTIEVVQEKKQSNYIVRCENCELMYVSGKKGFGLRKISNKYKKLDTSDYVNCLNCNEFKNQSVLSPNKKGKRDALGLIACYYPMVVKEAMAEKYFVMVE